MGLWDNIKDWFTKDEEEKLNVEKAKQDEKNVVEELLKMQNESKKADENAYQQGLIEALPKELDLEYLEYNGQSDDEIEGLVKDKYDDGHKENITQIEGQYELENQKLDSEKNVEAERKEENLKKQEENFDENVETFKNKALKNGIIESSIVSEQNEKFEETKAYDNEKVLKEFKERVELLDGEIAGLEYKKSKAIGKADNDYLKKLDAEISTLKKERDNKIKEVNSVNNKVDIAKAEYEKNKILAEQDYVDKYNDSIRKREESEAKYGYTGERKDEYEKRLNIALDFYSKFKKDDALNLIKNNKELKNLLGQNYNTLIRRINN